VELPSSRGPRQDSPGAAPSGAAETPPRRLAPPPNTRWTTIVEQLYHPLDGNPDEAPPAADVERALVEDLYRRSAITIWFFVPLLFLLRQIIYEAYVADRRVQVTFWATIVMVAATGTVALYLRRRSRDADDRTVRRRHNLFAGLAAVMGLALATTIALAYPLLTPLQVALVAVFLTGIHSVALASMGTSLRTYLPYVLPGLLVLLVLLAVRPDPEQGHVFLTMIALYVPSLTAMALLAYVAQRNNLRLRLQLANLALGDSLTGLRNRRFLTEMMPHEIELLRRTWADRAGAPLASLGILILDLDHFKSVNDRYGHGGGDELLRQVAQRLQETVRRPDLVVRWGGEEFVIVARPVDRAGALELAQRIRRRMAEKRFTLPSGQELQVTCSIGYALLPFDHTRPEEFAWEQVLALADLAMYEAKRRGRDRVVGLLSGTGRGLAAPDMLEAARGRLTESAAEGLLELVTSGNEVIAPRGSASR
jgi:diguanylate cyclase (GGDEF)-like protein